MKVDHPRGAFGDAPSGFALSPLYAEFVFISITRQVESPVP